MPRYFVPDYRGDPCLVTVPAFYTISAWLGSGTGGVVCQATDTRDDRPVALKSVRGHVHYARGALKVLRELRAMKHLAAFAPIIKLHDAFRCGDWQGSVCIVMDLMDTDLETVIRTRQVNDDNVTLFTYQLLLGLHYMHRCGIVHRDLKPSNLLVNEDCSLRIADFGSARDSEYPDTEYVVTRPYRAPELLMQLGYDSKVDVYAVGCIVGQMLKAMTTPPPPSDDVPDPAVLFLARHHVEQLKMILKLTGFPSAEDIAAISSTESQRFIASLHAEFQPGLPLFDVVLPAAPPAAWHLLGQLLKFNPANRISASEALCHEWLSERFEEEILAVPVQPFDRTFESVDDLPSILSLLDQELTIYPYPEDVDGVTRHDQQPTGCHTLPLPTPDSTQRNSAEHRVADLLSELAIREEAVITSEAASTTIPSRAGSPTSPES